MKNRLSRLRRLIFFAGAMLGAALATKADIGFYGATTAGGPQNYGTIFRISTNGEFATVVWFDGVHGARPVAAPTQGLDGNLYGTTETGGGNGFGTIYQLAIALPPPHFQGATPTDGVFSFAWSAIGGKTYQAQYNSDLGGPNWRNLGGLLTASNLAFGFSDPTTNEQRFDRVVQTQP